MVPPGIPDFATRERRLEPGPCTVRGRAWSGCGADRAGRGERRRRGDAGATRASARSRRDGPGWAWEWDWRADGPGAYEVCCRATDAPATDSRSGPVEPRRLCQQRGPARAGHRRLTFERRVASAARFQPQSPRERSPAHHRRALRLGAGLNALANWLEVPYPIPLVIGGLLLGLVPGDPRGQLDPDLVLLVFLPPLLYSAAFFADLRSLRDGARRSR